MAKKKRNLDTTISQQNVSVRMVSDPSGKAQHLRFAHIDAESKEEVMFLGSLDGTHKKDLESLREFITLLINQEGES